MQRGSMQGLGSSRELARPHGEGGLRRQGGLPFPSILLHAQAGGCWAAVGWGAPQGGAGALGGWASCCRAAESPVPSAREVGEPVPGDLRTGHTLVPTATGAGAGAGSAAGKEPDGRM